MLKKQYTQMEFRKKKVSYSIRVLRGLSVFILLAAALFLYFTSKYETNSFGVIAIPCFIIVFSFFRLESWYRYYITTVSIKNGIISIKFLDRIKEKSISIKSEDVEVKLDKAFSLSSTYKLILKISGKRVLVQYQNMNWKKEDLLKLHNLLS